MELWNSGIIDLLANSEPGFLLVLLTQIGLWAKVAIGIGLVIFVHELGHFVAAKSCGVKCEKFYVGFDVPIQIGPIKFPRTLGKFQWGETEYGLGIIPLGGYVKMLGQDDDPRRAAEENERIRIKKEGGDPIEEDEPEYELDPRSFQAKSVLQRMIIISAGVIVNVVTAVMFAACAFFYGVPYTPAIIGSTQPGDPAWVAGIQPGSQVLAVGDREPNEKLQFRDMTMSILEKGIDDNKKPIELLVRTPSGDESYSLNSTLRHDPKQRAALIGVSSLSSTKIADDIVAFPGSAAAEVMDNSFREARAISMNGSKLSESKDGDVLATPIMRELTLNPSEFIDLTFETKDGESKDVRLPPQKLKTIGCTFQVGPITAIVNECNAAKAGLKAGDRIVKFNGRSDLSAFRLRQLGFESTGATEIVVERSKEGAEPEELTFEVTPDQEVRFLNLETLGSDLLLDRFGISYQASNKIAAIDEASSLNEVFDPGDSITRLTVSWTDAEKKKELDGFIAKQLLDAKESWDFDEFYNVPILVSHLQRLPIGTEIRVLGQRDPTNGGKVLDTVAKVAEVDDQYWIDRGLRFASIRRIHKAESMEEAWSLGFNESLRRGKEVLRFLKMLVTGKVKAEFLGGPVAIVSIAGSQAAEGIPRLLMFLTFLSINLAILNFLPIPALDGGHMVFLIAEAVLGRPVNEELQAKLTMFGVLLLLCLMVFVFINDLARLFG